MNVTVSSAIGLCDGTKSAISLVRKIAKQHPSKHIYVFGTLIHNHYIDQEISNHGIDVIEDLTKAKRMIKKLSPENDIVIFSSHGHPQELEDLVRQQNIVFFDTTCPKVKAIFKQVKSNLAKCSNDIYYIGIKDHIETKSILSISKKIKFINYQDFQLERLKIKPNSLFFTQTSLSDFEITKIYAKIRSVQPKVHLYNNICDSSIRKQDSWYEVTNQQILLTIGDKISSNNIRLYELSQKIYPEKQHLMFQDLSEIKSFDFDRKKKIFINAGSSTPIEVILPIVEYLKSL